MSGEHLKELRTQLGLSQSELAGPLMTRNLLSMIENGHSPLTEKTAESLAQRINTLFSEKKDFKPVTAEDLSTPARYQARRDLYSILDSIAEFRFDTHFNIDHYLARISALFSQWDLPREKVQAYSLIADYFEYAGKNQEAHLYYSRAYENASRLEDPSELAETALSLSRTALKLEHYQSAILAAEVLRSYEGRIADLLLLEVFLNQAKAYMAVSDLDHALGSLIFCEHLLPTGSPLWLNQLMTLKIECYISKGMLGIASRILLSLENQVSKGNLENIGALRITTACLRGRISPSSLQAKDLENYWIAFSLAPASFPHYEELFLRLMEASLRTDNASLFEKIAWRALTDISPRTDPVSAINVMDHILKAWHAHPALNLMPHWKYFLNSEDHISAPGYAGLVLSYVSFFEDAGRRETAVEALHHFMFLRTTQRV